MATIKKEFMNRMLLKKISTLIIAVSLLLAPSLVRAQVEEYYDDQGVLVGTSDSRMLVSVFETEEHVEMQVTLIGKIHARAFFFSIVYDTTVLVLTDPTYNYDVPDGYNHNDFGVQVLTIPVEFSMQYPWHYVSPREHLPLIEGGAPNMKMFCTGIGVTSLQQSAIVHLEEGEMLHIYSIYFRKVNHGTPLTTSDFGYYAQEQSPEMYALQSPGWMYFAFEIRYAAGMPWQWFLLKPELFAFRSPSYVITEEATDVLATTATLHANFTRGDLFPTNELTVSAYADVKYDGKLNWDMVNQYGFIYSEQDADLSFKRYTNKIWIDGNEYDFPNSNEIALGQFMRNNKTFFIQPIFNNNSPNQTVNYEQNISGLNENTTYYAWSFIHYAYETSNTFLHVGNKIMFQTELPCETPFVEVVNFIYCDGEEVPEYHFTGSEDTDFLWERVLGYDFGMPQTEGMNTLPAFVAENFGFEEVSAVYKVTPVSHDGCTGEPQYFLITVNPRPATTPVEDMVYCNGTSVPRFDFAGTLPNAFYEWEFVSGADVVGITSGENYIPAFEAYNPGNEILSGKYRVRASYSFDNLTCYEYEWNEFYIVILPTPTAMATPENQVICSGETLNDILFSSNVSETVFLWERLSGFIPEIPSSGIGNITGMQIVNNGSTSIQATYKVAAQLNYPQYPQYNCQGNTAQFTITVLPQLQMNDIFAGVICSGNLFEYTINPNTQVNSISWTRVPHPDINNNEGANGNSAYIGETLINTGNSDVTVVYQITLGNGECLFENIAELTVVVTPNMVFDINPVTQVCSFQQSVTLTYVINVQGALFTLLFSEDALKEGFVSVMQAMPLPDEGILVNIPKGVQAGNYPALLTIYYGQCSVSYNIIIAVGSAPIATNTSPDEIFLCEREEFNLFVTVEGEVIYQWYFNNELIEGANAPNYHDIFYLSKEGEYMVKITSDCGEITYTFYVGANPAMILMKWDDVMYVENSQNRYVAFQWYKNGEPISIDGAAQYYTEAGGFTPHAEYNVKAFKADGAYDMGCPIIPNEGGKTVNGNLVIFPNPSNTGNSVTFKLTLPDGVDINADAYIYDVTGKLIKQFKITDHETQVQLNVAQGVYPVRVTTINGSYEFIDKLLILK